MSFWTTWKTKVVNRLEQSDCIYDCLGFVKILFGILRSFLAPKDFFTYRIFWECHNHSVLVQKIIRMFTTILVEQFMMHMVSSFWIRSSWYFLISWEAWRFKSLVCMKRTESHPWELIFICSIFIFRGIFGYYVVTPSEYHFLSNYTISRSSIESTVSLNLTIDNLTMFVLPVDCIELPMIVYFLAKVGILSR